MREFNPSRGFRLFLPLLLVLGAQAAPTTSQGEHKLAKRSYLKGTSVYPVDAHDNYARRKRSPSPKGVVVEAFNQNENAHGKVFDGGNGEILFVGQSGTNQNSQIHAVPHLKQHSATFHTASQPVVQMQSSSDSFEGQPLLTFEIR